MSELNKTITLILDTTFDSIMQKTAPAGEMLESLMPHFRHARKTKDHTRKQMFRYHVMNDVLLREVVIGMAKIAVTQAQAAAAPPVQTERRRTDRVMGCVKCGATDDQDGTGTIILGAGDNEREVECYACMGKGYLNHVDMVRNQRYWERREKGKAITRRTQLGKQQYNPKEDN